MYRSKTKIWTGLGAFVITAGSVQAEPPSRPSDQTATADPFANTQLKADYLSPAEQPLYLASQTGLAGEGGEGGEAGAAAGANPDEAYMTMLMLMHGHLRIGRALVEQQAWDDAIMHFRHPIEEIYGELQAELEQRQVEDFRAELDTLAGHVRDQESEPFRQAFDRVQAAIDTAVAALPAEVRQSATFKLNVAMRLLQQAALEYNAAIADGRIVNVAEYQDSRGFVWTAEELLNDAAAELVQRDAEAWQSMETLLADIKQAWPDVQPPDEPAQPVSRVLSNISRLDLQASRLR